MTDVEHYLRQAYWPWPLALAYSQSAEHRDECVSAVCEVFAVYGPIPEGCGEFTASSAVARIYEIVTGESYQNDAGYWERVAGLEAPLVDLMQAGQLDAWGRKLPTDTLAAIPVRDWVGAEILPKWRSDLVAVGWRDSDLLAQALGEKTKTTFWHDLHLKGGEVAQIVSEAAGQSSASLPDLIEFDGEQLREGYWPILPTLAWIASDGDEDFVAVVQNVDARDNGTAGDLVAAKWLTFGDDAGERYGCTFTMACVRLREALETGRLVGGNAKPLSEATRPIERYEWVDWRGHFQREGYEVLPRIYNPRWPSDAIRAAFPVVNQDGKSQCTTDVRFSGGRPRGAGRFVSSDKTHVAQMKRALDSGSATSRTEAAEQQWPECGGTSIDAARSRLMKAYRAEYGSAGLN